MMSPVELRRIIAEWRLRVQRVKSILQPQTWTEKEWRQFSRALVLLVREHGTSWIIDPNVYWDLRWKLQDGGELVCQLEHIPGEKTSLVVAQNGGFAVEVGSYTWLWAEFNMEGEFSRDPYWVDGTWKDALTALLLPLDRQSSYLLAGRASTPNSLLLQEGARPNDDQFGLDLLPGYDSENGLGEESESVHANGSTPAAEAAMPETSQEEPAPAAEFSSPPATPEASVPWQEPSNGFDEPAPQPSPVAASTNGHKAVRRDQPAVSTPELSAPLRRQRARLRLSRSTRKVGPRSFYLPDKVKKSRTSSSAHSTH